MRRAALLFAMGLGVTACGSDSGAPAAADAATTAAADAAVAADAPVVTDAAVVAIDARSVDAPPGDGPPPADARPVDAPPGDAPLPADARPIDAPPPADARPVDARPIDAPLPPDATPPPDAPPPPDATLPPDASPSIDAGILGVHPRILINNAAVRARLTAALTAKTPAATRFRDMVDRHVGGTDVYGFSHAYAALIGNLTGQAAYCAHAVTLADEIVADEEARITAGQVPEVAGDSYLGVGEEIGDLMLTYDWCNAALSDGQRQRWRNFAAQAVWNVWHHEQATWNGVVHDWSGWSVNNPSNNYYYSFLRATLLFGLAAKDEHPDAAGAIAIFRDDKIGDQLVPTFDRDLQGGGSREGTGYGTAMRSLFELYHLWGASTGERIDDLTPHTRASMFFFLHSWLPTLEGIAPTGDHSRDSSAAFFDYHRDYLNALADLVWHEEPMAGVVVTQLAASPLPRMENQFMFISDFLYEHVAGDVAAQPASALATAYRGIGTGQIFARSGWDEHATWIHFIAGPFTESHAHRDQGAFLYYRDEWLAYDQNIQSHSGIRNDEEVHNLVRVVSGNQTVLQRAEQEPSELKALEVTDAYTYMAADLTPIYHGHVAIDLVERELVFVKPSTLVVFDRVETAAGTQRIWQLNTPLEPVLAGTTARMGSLRVDRVLPAGAYGVVDWEQADDDMNGGFRLDSSDPAAGGRFLHVLSRDDEVTSVVASNDGNKLGCAITLDDGTVVTVRFNDGEIGGTLQIGAGSVVALTPGVDPLPLLADGSR